MSEPLYRPSTHTIFLVLPGLAALGLAIVYAAGALIKTAQLRGADVDVQDALPLVPVEQLLALGIGTLVLSLATVVGWLIVAVGFAYFAHRRRQRGETEETKIVVSPRAYRLLTAATIALAILVFLVLLTQASFFNAVALFAPAWVMGNVVQAKNRGDPRRVVLLLAGALVVVIVARIAEVWYTPEPLSRASISTRDAIVEGELVVVRGDAWVLYMGDRVLEVVPDSQIISATVTSAPPRKEQQVLTWP